MTHEPERRKTPRSESPGDVLTNFFNWLRKNRNVLGMLGGLISASMLAVYHRLEAQDNRIAKLEQSAYVVENFITSQCLDADSVQSLNLRRAQVPCARLMRERGITP